jgi:predicted nucleic acid-binding protein
VTADPPLQILDTSVFVRYLVKTPLHMAMRARSVIESDQTLLLTPIALAESGFVLTTLYEIPRDAAVEALVSLVQRQNIEMLGIPKSLALEALSLCIGSNRHSFADALLWAESRNLPGSQVLTFDHRFPAAGIRVLQLDAPA